LAGLLVPFLGLALGDRAGGETAVVPVPIHASKLRARGYNQSRLLAEGLARSRGFHLLDMLVKTKVTASQTSLERDSRVKNVVGSISARGAAAFYVERALLVDDVVTTGSTLRECARAMAAAGIKEISACAVAASL
jgi:competence protein ComFC